MDNDFFFKVLYEAIESGNNISISRSENQDDLFHFSSRFFKFDEDKSEILIDLPSSSDMNALRVNDRIEVFFISQGLRLGFFSVVKGFSEFKLLSDDIVPAIIIENPSEGLDLQRRRDFRIPTTPPLEALITYLPEEDDPKTKQIKEITIACLCDDISRSGIALTENKQNKDKLELKKGILISMNVKIDGNSIQMEGSVESKRELYEGKKIIFGVDFIEDKPDKIQYKESLNHNEIYHEAAERDHV